MNILQGNDLVNGAEGTATAVIDGRVEELFEVKNITATIDLKKTEVRTLGSRGSKHKTTGYNGTGSMTVYYITSRWTKMLIDYIKTGKVTAFDLIIKNQDPASATGKQVTKLIKCTIDGTDIAKLDVDADSLDQSVNFTFEDADILNEFDSLV